MKSAQGSYKNAYSGVFSRKEWYSGKISGVAPFYKFFLSRIAKTLFDNKIIKIDPSKNLEAAIQEFTSSPLIDLLGPIDNIEDGTTFGPEENLLYKAYVSLEKLISSSLPKSDSDKVIETIKQHFDFMYYIQGDMSKNKFYKEFRLIFYRIHNIISGTTTISGYDGSLNSLDYDVLKGIGIMSHYGNLKKSKKPTKLEMVANLRTSIVDNLGPYITSAQLDKILVMVDDYKESIIAYHGGNDLLSTYKDGYRKALIADLINSKFTTILQHCSSINSLSDLFFDDRRDLVDNFFVNNRKGIYDRPELFVLRHIRLRVATWSTEDFKSEGSIDQTTLDSLIEEIIVKIDKFITFESLPGYRKDYKIKTIERIKYRTRYVQKGYESTIDLIHAYHQAVAAFTGNSKATKEMLGKIAGLSALKQGQSGYHFALSSLQKMVGFLQMIKKDDATAHIPPHDAKYDFMSRLTLNQRQDFYDNALKTIEKYMTKHSIGYSKDWKKQHIMAYHIFKLLKRNLGFDILSFTTLEKGIFKFGSKIKFQRHHFRNAFFRKLSNYVQDLVLTDAKIHGKYRSYSEEQILVILKGFDKMMEMDGAITKDDVIDIFEENEWVLNGFDGKGDKSKKRGWFFSDEDFDQMLKEFNKRKIMLKDKGLDQFIIKNYDTVYERFYLNFPHGTLSGTDIADADGFYSLVVPHPWLGDFAMGMNFDARFLYPEY